MEQKKILIVEDDLVLLETLQDILASNGYDCLGCHHTDHVLEQVEQFRPDLLILDYMLPDWNGGELCGAIRSLDGFEYTPVLIISAYAKILLSLAEYGCDAVLEKPFSVDELLKVVNSLISSKSTDSGLLPKIKTIVKRAIPRIQVS
ncbi:response regulator [Pedobacter chinensis]|uniref:Response regulator n=1 Tax=Pedobacter chinensis TaxID=2282421 RepID=A0A369PUS8_9SPHI|nr:response regulator [Pedobacter chinensis]RDC56020.1 response regulator [Pedobacter chinensis]